MKQISRLANTFIQQELRYSAPNYISLPVVIDRVKDVYAWDVNGTKYFDFLSAYSAVNQGHLHPSIVGAAIRQLGSSSLTSRAFHNSIFPDFARKITNLTGYDKVLPMNTGAEGVETACKLSRKWGYEVKNIPENEGIIVSANNCFHGRTYMSISLSNDPSATDNFGPLLNNIVKIDYDSVPQLEEVFDKYGDRMCSIILEPIQGEGGVVIPRSGYLNKVEELCKKHNVLFICDEIQTGLGRTGKMFGHQWDNVRPDVLILGKALGGGIYPISAVLADDQVMKCMSVGTHGSTFGGNPLACAVGIEALNVIVRERLVQNSQRLGENFRKYVNYFNSNQIYEVRGRGLMNAIEIKKNARYNGDDFCKYLALEKHILTKQTRENVIRFTPPLTISPNDFTQCIGKINETIKSLNRTKN